MAKALEFITTHEREPQSLHLPLLREELSDSSVITDMELGIRQIHVAFNHKRKAVSDTLLSTILPPFTCLQKLTEENVKHMNSVYGVVASVTSKSVVYQPIPETGVITAVSSSGVTLSMLNADSGILEENVYPASSISLHKYRLLYYLGNVKLLRGVTGRICCTLAMKYVRELLICLLYYAHMNGVDVMTAWPIHPHEVVRLTQYTYTTYLNNLILNPSKQNHITLVSCLFRILKGSVKNMVLESPRGSELLSALLDGVWSEVPDPGGKLHPGVVSARPLLYRNAEHAVHSLHPCLPRTKYSDSMTIAGAAGLRVVFDERCCLDGELASLTFYRNEELTDVIARFTGEPANFCAFTVRGSTLRFVYESGLKAKATWGYAFVVQPFENIQWSGDISILNGLCFDWNCYVLDLVVDICKEKTVLAPACFERLLRSLLCYLRISGMPFKSRVVQLLIRMMGIPMPRRALPDVTLTHVSSLTPSGLYTIVMDYCGAIDDHSLVPAQLPLLIEFLASYRLAEPLAALSVRDADQPLLPFQADPRLEVASSQQGSEERSEQGSEQKSEERSEETTEQTTEQRRTTPETSTKAEAPSSEHMPSGEPSGELTEPSLILSSAQIDTPTPSLRATIDTVYLLTRCLYYQSMPPQPYLRLILHKCGQAWTADAYATIARCYRRFTRRTDLQLIAAFEQSAKQKHFSMLSYDVRSFALTEEDRARYYALGSFSNAEIRLRLCLIQYYNVQLRRVVHLVDLGSKDSCSHTLGTFISLLTGYIFPAVKEDFLELSIAQTVYQGKDSCPVVELDNRRVFTDMERSEFEEEDRNAMTSQCTFAQLYRQMQKHPVDVLRANLDARDRLLAVKYKGEQGLDWGGLYHDTIERWWVNHERVRRSVEDLFSDHIDLFLPCPNSRAEEQSDEVVYVPNPKYRESSDVLSM